MFCVFVCVCVFLTNKKGGQAPYKICVVDDMRVGTKWLSEIHVNSAKAICQRPPTIHNKNRWAFEKLFSLDISD